MTLWQPNLTSSETAHRARRRWAVICAMLWGGGLGIAVSGVPLAIILASLPPGSETTSEEFAALARIAVAVSAAISAFTLGALAAMNPPARKPQRRDPCAVTEPAPARAFDQRLSQYLEEEPAPSTGADTEEKSRMAFFLAFLPGPRTVPSQPATFAKC